ncbi:acyl-CoA dehydrogenase family protein [Xanthobacter sp. DSM 24535]|uniref:acyl-CoA dehydrogenase family protein n=1 Tax=Roseixanthobacter psychrophilus TaxID=3119917 RepID=UPI003728CF09
MDFRTTERQQELIDSAARIAVRNLMPLAQDHSPQGVQRLREAMAQAGLLGLNMPESHGGVGLPLLDTLMIVQTLQSHASIMGGLAHRSSTGAVGAISELGTDAQRDAFVSGVCAGRFGIGIGITEPEAGSAATSMTTRARIEGDSVVLNGRKQFVSFVDNNSYTLTYCRFGSTGKASDIGAVIVPHDAPGFSRSKGSLNMADELLFELYFDECRVPRENVLLDGSAFGKLISVYNAERLGSLARMLGSAEAAFALAVDYAKTRRQFGREIGEFQGIQWMLADMKVKLEAAKLMVYRAASNAGHGLPNPAETSMAKVFTAQAAKEVCDAAIQIFGANGYMKEFPLAQRYAEVRGGSIYGGTIQIHKNMIAGAVLGRSNNQWRREPEPKTRAPQNTAD